MEVFMAFSWLLWSMIEYWAKLCVSAEIIVHILTVHTLMVL